MQIVWEARFFSTELIMLIFCCLLTITISVIFFIKKSNKHPVISRCISAVVFVLALEFLVSSCIFAIDDWNFAKNNRIVVEGTVENFSGGNNGADSFTVNGVYFSLPDADSNLYAYDCARRDGGVIYGNGQNVRLTYCVQNGVNSILKIEIQSKTGNGSAKERGRFSVLTPK